MCCYCCKHLTDAHLTNAKCLVLLMDVRKFLTNRSSHRTFQRHRHIDLGQTSEALVSKTVRRKTQRPHTYIHTYRMCVHLHGMQQSYISNNKHITYPSSFPNLTKLCLIAAQNCMLQIISALKVKYVHCYLTYRSN